MHNKQLAFKLRTSDSHHHASYASLIMSTFASQQSAESPQATSAQASTTNAAASSSTQAQAPQPTRQAAEEARKDRTLAEFMLMLDEYEPLVYIACCMT